MASKAKEKELDFQDVADECGKRVVAGLREELDALNHASACDGSMECGCASGACKDCCGYGSLQCSAGADSEDQDAWHDEDRARRHIEESPLSVEVRSGWYSPGGEPGAPEEYVILLGTGGPAARIRGELSEYGEPTSAVFEYQDWFKPWTEARLTDEEEATLLAWAQVFYFGG